MVWAAANKPPVVLKIESPPVCAGGLFRCLCRETGRLEFVRINLTPFPTFPEVAILAVVFIILPYIPHPDLTFSAGGDHQALCKYSQHCFPPSIHPALEIKLKTATMHVSNNSTV
jgi:hypothetical protein